MKTRLLDTSGILRTSLDFSCGGFLITGAVLQELESDNARLAVDAGISCGKIRVHDPSEERIMKVKAAAAATGDLEKLSETDVGLLAVALETGSIIVSDDYNIQNTASVLHIQYEGKTQDGIKRSLVWKKKCIGCGRTYPPESTVCSVCGSQLKRKSSAV
jgi:UPF0271 protein